MTILRKLWEQIGSKALAAIGWLAIGSGWLAFGAIVVPTSRTSCMAEVVLQQAAET